MPTKLSVFNDALGMLGQPLMNTDLDPGEDGDTLRGHWETKVAFAHEKTAWDHAKVQWKAPRLATKPEFGYDYYYQLPPKFARLVSISETGMVGDDLLDYDIIDGKIATNVASVYATCVTTDSLERIRSKTESFAHYVATEIALAAAPRINSSAIEAITKERKKAQSDAGGLDAAQGPPRRRPHGTWSKAARGFRGSVDREQRD